MTKVFLQGPGQPPYRVMFAKKGFKEAKTLEEADIVCFTGGADVSPSLYNELTIPGTYVDKDRDERDKVVFEASKGKFRVGICRGGQFLNVMSGGAMYQDVDKHTTSHMVKDLKTKKKIFVTSTHHQMMRPSEEAVILCEANESTYRKTGQKLDTSKSINCQDWKEDVEAVWYPKTKCLCFQPHPEFAGANPTMNYFFELIQRYYKND